MFKITKLSLTVLVYHTERLNLILNGIQHVIPKLFKEKMKEKTEIIPLRGLYGERIKLVKVVYNRLKEIEAILKHIFSQLPIKDLKELFQSFEGRFDNKRKIFHFRLDKFSPFNDLLQLGSGSDTIKIQVKWNIYKTVNIELLENYFRSFLGDKIAEVK